jgi:signal transduction histidine kinase
MEGFDRDWVHAGMQNAATYTNLDPGDYVFRVRGSNSDGVWNEQGASIRMIIHPPFWETWWFRILMGIILAGLLFLAYRIRVGQILAVERLRTRIASDLHDDVGSALTRIAVHSEVIQNTRDQKKIVTSSQMIGEMSREIVGTLSDLVWSIDARRDTFQELANRMRSFGLDLLSTKDIRFQLTTDVPDMTRNIAVDVRQNLYLIFKEAVNNIAKHSGASEAQASLGEKDGWLIMTIRDNGKGLPEAVRSGGQGLKNMKMRAQRIGGRIEIMNAEGLRIVIRVKG